VSIGGSEAPVLYETSDELIVRHTAATIGPMYIRQPTGEAVSAGAFSCACPPSPVAVRSIEPPTVYAGVGEQLVTLRGNFFPTPMPSVHILGNGVIVPARVVSLSSTSAVIALPAVTIERTGSVVLTYTQLGANPLSTTIEVVANSVPQAMQCVPNSTTASFQPFVLGIVGKGLSRSSRVLIENAVLPQEHIVRLASPRSPADPDTLFVRIPDTLNIWGGQRQIRVHNRDTLLGTSRFVVHPAERPAITSISPSLLIQGVPEQTITIHSTNSRLRAGEHTPTVLLAGVQVPVLSNDGRTMRVAVPQRLVSREALLMLELLNPDRQYAAIRLPVRNADFMPPILTNLSPASIVQTSGQAADSIVVTLTGEHFTRETQVLFETALSGVARARTLMVSTNAIVARVPVHIASRLGRYTVRVEHPNRHATTATFMVVEPHHAPVIQSFMPPSNTQRAGTGFPLVITGRGLHNVRVWLQGRVVDTLSIVQASDTALTVLIPPMAHGGQRTVVVQNAQGLQATSVYGLLVFTPQIPLSVASSATKVPTALQSSLQLYPNPTHESLTVELSSEPSNFVRVRGLIRVLNVLG